MKDRKKVDLNGGGEEELGALEGRKSIMRIHNDRKKSISIKEKKNYMKE